jgi:hypothetical protein
MFGIAGICLADTTEMLNTALKVRYLMDGRPGRNKYFSWSGRQHGETSYVFSYP